MRLDPVETYELKAEAFRIMTGHMAPGKDVSAAGWAAPYEERAELWSKWCAIHADVAHAFVIAAGSVLKQEEE